MPNYREKSVENIQQFVALIDSEKERAEQSGNNADLLFRGQSVDEPLLPKIARLKLRGEVSQIENLILEEFRRTGLHLAERWPNDSWDLIALAQHHGLPTRLLDWTYSALIALWFAVKDVPSKKESNGVVWIMTPEVSDFKADTEDTTPQDNKKTRIYRPAIISKRISSQSGVFTVHKINSDGKFINLERNAEFSCKLLKTIIPSRSFPSIRHRLNMLGVNSSTAFPDLDGLCAHLQWRFSFLKDEHKN